MPEDALTVYVVLFYYHYGDFPPEVTAYRTRQEAMDEINVLTKIKREKWTRDGNTWLSMVEHCTINLIEIEI